MNLSLGYVTLGGVTFSLSETIFFLSYFSLFFLLLVLGETPFGIYLMGLMTVLFFLFRKKIEFIHVKQHGYLFLTFFIFIFLAVLNLFVTQSLPLSLNKIIFFIFSFLNFSFFALVDQKWLSNKIIATGFVLVGVGLSALSMLFFFLPKLSEHLNSFNLLVSTFGHNHASVYFIFAIPLAFCLWQEEVRAHVHQYFLYLLTCIVFGLCFTFARVDIGLGLLEIIVLLGVTKSANVRKQKLLISLLAVPLFTVLFVLGLLSFFSIFQLPCPLPQYQSKICKVFTKEPRPNYWRKGIELFVERPILGWGGETYGIMSKQRARDQFDYTAYVHNDYFEILVVYGVIGGGFLLLFLFLLLRISIDTVCTQVSFLKKSKNSEFFFAISCLALGLDALFDYNWHYLGIWVAFLISAAVVVRKTNSKNFVTHTLKISPSSKSVKVVFHFFSGILILWMSLYSMSSILWEEKNYDTSFKIFPFVYWRVEDLIGTTKVANTTSEWLSHLYWSHTNVLEKYGEREQNLSKKVVIYRRLVELFPQSYVYRFQLFDTLIREQDWQAALKEAEDINGVYQGKNKDLIDYSIQVKFVEQLVSSANSLFEEQPELARNFYFQAYVFDPMVNSNYPFRLLYIPTKYPETAQNLLKQFSASTDLWRYQDVLADWYFSQLEESFRSKNFASVLDKVISIQSLEKGYRWKVWSVVSPLYQNFFEDAIARRDLEESQQILDSWRKVLNSIEGENVKEKVEYQYVKKLAEDYSLLGNAQVLHSADALSLAVNNYFAASKMVAWVPSIFDQGTVSDEMYLSYFRIISQKQGSEIIIRDHLFQIKKLQSIIDDKIRQKNFVLTENLIKLLSSHVIGAGDYWSESQLGNYYYMLGNIDQAKKTFQACVMKNPLAKSYCKNRLTSIEKNLQDGEEGFWYASKGIQNYNW